MSVKLCDHNGKFVHVSPSGNGAASGAGALDVNLVNSLNIQVSLSSGDIEIGAVELKDSATNSRATIASSAVWVSPRTLPPGAATSALQNTQINRETSAVTELKTLNSLIPSQYRYISLSYNTSGKVSQAVFKSTSTGSTVSTLNITYNTSGKISAVNRV